MIKTFRDSETEKVFNGRFSRKLPQDIQRIAERKLIMFVWRDDGVYEVEIVDYH